MSMNVRVQQAYLEARGADSSVWRVPIQPLPFRIGRNEGLSLTVPSDAVSAEHAEIRCADDELLLFDLGSTNGTLVNRRPVEQGSPLHDGDIVRIADFEFRVVRPPSTERHSGRHTVVLADGLRASADSSLVGEPVFQPIVQLPGCGLVALEQRGGGVFSGQLSDTIVAAAGRPELPPLFLDVREADLGVPALLESLAELHRRAPGVDVVLEIPTRLLGDTRELIRLRDGLQGMGVQLAYDWLGGGHAQLMEWSRVPPDFLTFGASFVLGLDSASSATRRVLTALVAAAFDFDAVTMARGVQTAAELEVCTDVGLVLAQGDFLGHPAPLEELLSISSSAS